MRIFGIKDNIVTGIITSIGLWAYGGIEAVIVVWLVETTIIVLYLFILWAVFPVKLQGLIAESRS